MAFRQFQIKKRKINFILHQTAPLADRVPGKVIVMRNLEWSNTYSD